MRQKILQILIISLILFQVQDGLCTYIGIDKFGIGVEANPFIVFLINILGLFWGVTSPKIFAIIFSLFIYSSLGDRVNNYVLGVMLFINLFYAYAAYNWMSLLYFS